MALDDRSFEDRANIIGGSEVATILGLNRWQTPAGLMAQKLAGTRPDNAVEKERIMAVGKAMEETVLGFFEAVNPNRNFSTGPREPQYLIKNSRGDAVIIVSHPDVMRFETDITRGRHTVRLLELKTTTGWRDDISSRDVPKEYETQVQMELHGANQSGVSAEVADLAIYNLSNGQLHTHQAVYDKAFCEQAVERCTEFYDLLMSDREHEEILRAVAGPNDNIVELLQIAAKEETMAVGEDGEEVNTALEMLERLGKAKAALDSWGSEFMAAKNAVANLMGDKMALEVFGEKVVSYSNTRPPARNSKPIREFQTRVASPENVALMAKMILPKMGVIEGVTEAVIMDALEPAVVQVSKMIAQAQINENVGKPNRMFKPNYARIDNLVGAARAERDIER